MTVKELFESRMDDSRWNTSYPLSPEDWAAFRVQQPLSFKEDKVIAFYIHVPFCKQLCTFCEYVRMICPDEEQQATYIDTLNTDIKKFKSKYTHFVLKGFDIGGGTPTCLSEHNFCKLMNVYDEAISGLQYSEDYEPSIEGTFRTLSRAKLERIAQSGIHRLSLGVQSVSNDVLCSHHREMISAHEMKAWMEVAYQSGIQKINLDLMYGLLGQNGLTIEQDLELVGKLHPQQVTLYELRTNMITLRSKQSKKDLYSMYGLYYSGLVSMGYHARFGQNTFSLDSNDYGASSYIRSRMLDGCAYKGFGISAQSMSHEGVSYNLGKGMKNIAKLLATDSFKEEFTYMLPPEELASKYIAIAAYYGAFSLETLESILPQPEMVFKNELDFCLSSGLLQKSDDGKVVITKKGFIHYGEVFSLFYKRFFKN